MRIIALSDTHLEEGVPKNLEDLVREADLILHAGDFITLEVYQAFAELGELKAVCGNSDCIELKKVLPERTVVEAERVRLGLVHRASYSSELTGAEFLAREMEVDALIFGHIHRPHVEKGDKLLICPGSPTVPRMSPPTVAEIEVQEGEIKGRILPLGKAVCNYIKYAEAFAEKEKGWERVRR
jgi:putative phosphoesterase